MTSQFIGALLSAWLGLLLAILVGVALYAYVFAGVPLPTLREKLGSYDGPFSTYAEWHAATIGVYHGLVTRPWNVSPEQIPDHPDVKREPHYYKGGHVTGAILQAVLLVIVTSTLTGITTF